MTAPRKRRPTWQDPRRVRRMAVLLIHPLRISLMSASSLDQWATTYGAESSEEWGAALLAAEHYLRELGRTRT